MIRDLDQAGEPSLEKRSQVCIIGGGTAGLFLAWQLRRHGIQVLVLEAGNRLARTPESLDHHCDQLGIRYRGAESGRSFGLGGTSVLWGGQLLPVSPSDVGSRAEVGYDAWPIPYETLVPYFTPVAQALGLRARPDAGLRDSGLSRTFSTLEAIPDFELRLSTWLPFRKRNFSQAFAGPLGADDGLEVWLNASVQELLPDEAGRIAAVKACGQEGRTLHVQAEVVVLAAGALESTRLLLEHDEHRSGALTTAGAPLGRYFADHLSVTCGRFSVRHWKPFNLAVAPVFQRGLMRTPRLELSARTQRRAGTTSAFAHFSFVTRGDTGFDLVRNVLRRRQGEAQPLQLTPSLLAHAVLDISSMAFWRGIHRRLWIPRKAEVLLQVDIEQTPNPDSRLKLSERRDARGRKRLAIDWRIQPADVHTLHAVAGLTQDAWRGSALTGWADLELTLPERFDTFETLYDVYHPTGSLRMGTSPSGSVVDRHLRLWASDNCYVTSTAVFPSAGSANPGFTHLALTARLADHLRSRLAGGAAPEGSRG